MTNQPTPPPATTAPPPTAPEPIDDSPQHPMRRAMLWVARAITWLLYAYIIIVEIILLLGFLLGFLLCAARGGNGGLAVGRVFRGALGIGFVGVEQGHDSFGRCHGRLHHRVLCRQVAHRNEELVWVPPAPGQRGTYFGQNVLAPKGSLSEKRKDAIGTHQRVE